jgi:hypothetical protein
MKVANILKSSLCISKFHMQNRRTDLTCLQRTAGPLLSLYMAWL